MRRFLVVGVMKALVLILEERRNRKSSNHQKSSCESGVEVKTVSYEMVKVAFKGTQRSRNHEIS